MDTIKEWVISIIGEYTPDYTAANFGQIDFVWIASAIVLIVLVLYFFKSLRFVLTAFFK